MNFSTNQVMQFYALDGLSTATAAVKSYSFEKAAKIVFTKEGGDVIASDKIENVMWGKVTTSDALKKALKSLTITISEVIAGQDYIVRVSYPEVAGLGVEGWATKTAVYTAKTGDTAATIYVELAKTLKAAFEADGVLEVSDNTVGEEGAAVESTGITIAVANPTKKYRRGTHPVVLSNFEVTYAPIIKDGEEVTEWYVETESETPDYVTSGYAVAEMEYFAMGERGDEYRGMGYPDTVVTDYMVDPKGAYNVLNVHFAYKGANDQSHLSEKDIVVVSTKEADLTAIVNELKKTFTDVKFTKVTADGEAAL